MAQKVYIFTEAEKQALIESLELEKLTAGNNQFIRPDSTPEQIAESIHRRFHYRVCRAFENF